MTRSILIALVYLVGHEAAAKIITLPGQSICESASDAMAFRTTETRSQAILKDLVSQARGMASTDLTVPLEGQVYVISSNVDARTRTGAVFIPEVRPPSKEVWQDLSGEEQLHLVDGLFRILSKAPTGVDAVDLLATPKEPKGLSATQVLKAAVEGRPIPECRACAAAAILNTLGAPPNSISLAWGRPQNGGERQFYLMVKAKGGPSWIPFGARPEDLPKDRGQDPFFLEAQYVSQPLNQSAPYERPRVMSTTPSNNSAHRGNRGVQIRWDL